MLFTEQEYQIEKLTQTSSQIMYNIVEYLQKERSQLVSELSEKAIHLFAYLNENGEILFSKKRNSELDQAQVPHYSAYLRKDGIISFTRKLSLRIGEISENAYISSAKSSLDDFFIEYQH